jgi:hypothetical protein
MTAEIEHVTDTAFWVASYRALESGRPDTLFRDLLTRILSGGVAEDIHAVQAEPIRITKQKPGRFARESVSTRQEALRVGRRPPCFSMTAPLLSPLGSKRYEKADRVIGYTMLERQPR